MEKHISIIGILYIVFGVLGLLAGFIVFVALAGSGVLSGDEEAFVITSGIGAIIGGIIVVLSVPAIVGRIFLLQKKEWARILILILSFLNLLSIPFGTALGGYSIWALMNDETIRLFRNPVTTHQTT
ncbi:MAG: hypothetical protein ACKVRP_07485 [Bacteroidota bacterium]